MRPASTPATTFTVVLAATLVVAPAMVPTVAYAQSAIATDGLPALELVAREVARAWGTPAEIVRVELVGDLPPGVDSLLVEAGGRDRWILKMWVGEGSIRRFVNAGVMAPAAVATRDLVRGVTVDSADVRIEPRVVWGVPDPDGFVDPVGMTTERVIAAGEALVAPGVRPPLLVHGGDSVEAVLERSGIVMRVQAEALGSARDGEKLLVRLASGMRTEARVVAPGIVTLIEGGS
jgi:flagella basal body P-ring formation protein FlgA